MGLASQCRSRYFEWGFVRFKTVTQMENENTDLATGRWSRPIQRASLHEEIVARLRAMIQEGGLPPGSRVPELKLCERFGISRTPLREALKVLASEGLVVLLPNRGSMVSRVEVAELEAVFEVMESLEALTGRLVCQRAGSRELSRLQELHATMVERFRAGDRAGYFRYNQRIHQALVAAADNPVLTTTYEQLATKINRARAMANTEERRWGESLAEHEEIMQALDTLDGESLAARLASHTRNTARAVLEALRQRGL